jgi:hypothetical protein
VRGDLFQGQLRKKNRYLAIKRVLPMEQTFLFQAGRLPFGQHFDA